ncbi:MAG: hypothetical protein GX640_10170, partial [Fibrobacter sp.]|nr:hypothetical protein [Fibrobacter sp.]
MCKISLIKILIFILLVTAGLNAGNNDLNIKEAASIIVLDEGRKKPLDSYARKKLIQISGKKKIAGESALEWLLKLMFNPALVDHLECFRILNPETIDALSIKGPYKRRYSYNEIYPALDKCERIVFSI